MAWLCEVAKVIIQFKACETRKGAWRWHVGYLGPFMAGIQEWRHGWSKMTLTYLMMVERYPNLKEEVGGSIPNCEISSQLDKKIQVTILCQKLASKKIANCLLCFGAGMSTFCLKQKEKRRRRMKTWWANLSLIISTLTMKLSIEL